MPKQINSPSPGQRLVRLFGIKGRYQPILDEVVVPVVSVDAEAIEQVPASAWGHQAAGGVGTTVTGIIQNSTTGTVIRVRAVQVYTSAQDQVYAYIAPTFGPILSGGSTGLNVWWRDTGKPGNPSASVKKATSTTTASGFEAFSWACGPNESGVLILPDEGIILQPSGTFQIFLASTNTAFDFSFFWTEEPYTVTAP